MLKPLSNSVQQVQGRLFERKFTTLGRILSYWKVIVGEDLAAVSRPVKIRFRRKAGGFKGKTTAVLDVATDSANAVLFSYRKDLMLEKINQLLGQNTVSDIRFVHYAVENLQNTDGIGYKHSMLPDIEEKDREIISSITGIVDDDKIKQSLENIGAFVFADKAKR